MGKKGVLLVNLGTPDSPKTANVRKYLNEFLMDRYVIDINPVTRALLLKGVIVPFRSPKSEVVLGDLRQKTVRLYCITASNKQNYCKKVWAMITRQNWPCVTKILP